MTSIEWLIEQCPRIEMITSSELIEQAKEMHYKELMDSMHRGMELQEKQNNRIGFRERNGLLPQQEISDEEIEKEVNEYAKLNQILIDKFAWMDAIKWYREQLKQKQ
jgi:hypothetical protein